MHEQERRRSPRVQIFGKLHGQLVALEVPITVTEISLGGLTMESPIEFPDGVVHEFALTLGDGSQVSVKGRVLHSRRIGGSSEQPRYVVGVQFIDDEAAEIDTVISSIR
jgi:hypothetical protein